MIKGLVRLCKCLTRYQSVVSHLPHGTNGAQAVNVRTCSDNPFTETGNILCTAWRCFMLRNNDTAFVFTCLMFSSRISNLTPGSKAFLCSKRCCFIWATLEHYWEVTLTGKHSILMNCADERYPSHSFVCVKRRDAHRLIMTELCLYGVNSALNSFAYVVEAIMVNKECVLPAINTNWTRITLPTGQ